MKNVKIVFLLIFASCAPKNAEVENESIEKVSFIEFKYRERSDRKGYDFYLASLHELESDGSLRIFRRKSFNSPLQLFSDSTTALTSYFPELAESYQTDTTLMVINNDSQELSNSFLHMLIIERSGGRETVVGFDPETAEGGLASLAHSLKRPNSSLNEFVFSDTASIISKADSIVRRVILPKHPLPPNSQPPPLYKDNK
ncbi:hypothetical protein [Rufibacter psychrotolerans]|uniref:hypothetical protein n=1 Tax=Rufibacter psychrotolerans TaxID=2812556 RepID=UPI0019687C02|nr:hypothetical protein [Rufibacter sp. SYSU D00308]